MSKVLIFTDLHAGYTLSHAKGIDWVNTYGTEILQHVKKLSQQIKHIQPDLVINLWDVIDWRYEGNISTIIKEYQSSISDHQIYHVMWNHDQSLLWKEWFQNTFGQNTKIHIELPDSDHIIMEALKYKKDIISINDEWIQRLKDTLSKCKNWIYVYFHYPISGDIKNISYYHTWKPHKAFVYEHSTIRAILEEFNVKWVINWHTHLYFQKTINWILHTTVPSFSENSWERPSLEYAILETDNGNISIESLYWLKN